MRIYFHKSLEKVVAYKINYNENACAYVLNPKNFRDWVLQKKRNIKGHISLGKFFKDDIKRKNTMMGEAIRGLYVFSYPRNIKEFFWGVELLFARLYIWLSAYYEVYFKKQEYKDGWREEETESTIKIKRVALDRDNNVLAVTIVQSKPDATCIPEIKKNILVDFVKITKTDKEFDFDAIKETRSCN